MKFGKKFDFRASTVPGSLFLLGESHNIEILWHDRAPPGLPTPKFWLFHNSWFRRYAMWDPFFSGFRSTLLQRGPIKNSLTPLGETHNLKNWWHGRPPQGLPLPKLWPFYNHWFSRYTMWDPFFRRFMVTSLYGALGKKSLSPLGKSHNIEI